MIKKEHKEFIEWQESLVKPQVEAAVDHMMQEVEYAPPAPDPLHPALSEKAARKKLKQDLTQLMLSQNPSERILMGFDLIFEHLQEVPNGNMAKEELKQAGNRISEGMFAPALKNGKTLDDLALSFVSKAATAITNEQSFTVDWGISFDTYQTIYMLANLFFEKEEFNEAACIFEVLNLIDGSCHEAWFGAGLCHYRLEHWREAAADFAMAAQADPTSILSFTNLAHCYINLHEHENAIEMIDHAEAMMTAPNVDPSLKMTYQAALKDLRKQAA